MRGSRASRVLCVALGASLLAAMPALPAASARTATTLHAGAGLSTNFDFARLVLADGGWPQSASNVTVLTQWLRAEEPTYDWWNRANPLNNGLGSGGGSGLGSYRSLVTAAYYVARNLENPAYGYPLIVRDLEGSVDPSATARAIWRSQWASGHYGWGADWSTTPVPAVSAPSAPWQSPTACPIDYPKGVIGPCGSGFSATGAGWHTGSPGGLDRQELWAYSGAGGARSSATWQAALAAGNYAVAAFIPASFSDATVSYVVVDARGAHHVTVHQEPFANAWASLGIYTSAAGSRLKVQLAAPVTGRSGATYVAADAMRFVPTTLKPPDAGTHPTVGARRAPRLPGAPVNVAAVPGDHGATVTWLAPSKDGGAPVEDYTVTAAPGGRGCDAMVRASGIWSCTVAGLANGTAYVFRVRATNKVGPGAASAPSNQVRPQGTSQVRLVLSATRFEVGQRLVVRALVGSAAKGGTVLFFEDGRALRGCQSARIVRGAAACSLRLDAAAPHVLLASFTGDATLSGNAQDASIVVARATTTLRASVAPGQVDQGSAVTFRAWHLPGHATGKIVFDAGAVRLCVASVASGGGSCTSTAALAVGVHLVTARYAGDRDFEGSTARTSFQVLVVPPAS